ncbi:MAG: hypothetical protein K6U79_04760 [Firmicutes bacterium]|nr:hypothetical protein [Bacillota bacterium]
MSTAARIEEAGLVELAQRLAEGDRSALVPLLAGLERSIRSASRHHGRPDREVADALRAELAILLLGLLRRGLPARPGPSPSPGRGRRRPDGRRALPCR